MKKIVRYPWDIFSKLPEKVKGAVLFLIWYMKIVTLNNQAIRVVLLDLFRLYCPNINLHSLNYCEYTKRIVQVAGFLSKNSLALWWINGFGDCVLNVVNIIFPG